MDTRELYPNPPRESEPQPVPQFLQTPQTPVPVGPQPIITICPLCRSQILSKVTRNATTKTHLMSFLLCCCMCWPCACLPYCMKSCRNTNHYCPSCGAFIGTYKA